MTSIQQSIPPATPNAAAGATSRSQTTSASIGAEFDTFLTLLTAQIRNQDPLAPLDSTQFVEQLATFSSLEQQVQTNSILEGMAEMLTTLHASASADWVGKSVAVPSPILEFDGRRAEFTFDAPAAADTALLAVRTADGRLLGHSALDLGAGIQTWDGRIEGSSQPLPSGSYFVEVELYRDGAALGSVLPKFAREVSRVQVQDQDVMLVTNEGQKVLARSVDQLKPADAR